MNKLTNDSNNQTLTGFYQGFFAWEEVPSGRSFHEFPDPGAFPPEFFFFEINRH